MLFDMHSHGKYTKFKVREEVFLWNVESGNLYCNLEMMVCTEGLIHLASASTIIDIIIVCMIYIVTIHT